MSVITARLVAYIGDENAKLRSRPSQGSAAMRVFRIFHGYQDFDMMHLEHMRKVIRQGQELLEAPLPDTFAGRKTQEPFPRQEKDTRITWWVASKKLEPPK